MPWIIQRRLDGQYWRDVTRSGWAPDQERNWTPHRSKARVFATKRGAMTSRGCVYRRFKGSPLNYTIERIPEHEWTVRLIPVEITEGR